MALGTLRGVRGDGLESVMTLSSVRGDGVWDSNDTVRGHKRRWHWFSHSKEGGEGDKGRWCWFPQRPGDRRGQCCWVPAEGTHSGFGDMRCPALRARAQPAALLHFGVLASKEIISGEGKMGDPYGTPAPRASAVLPSVLLQRPEIGDPALCWGPSAGWHHGSKNGPHCCSSPSLHRWEKFLKISNTSPTCHHRTETGVGAKT